MRSEESSTPRTARSGDVVPRGSRGRRHAGLSQIMRHDPNLDKPKPKGGFTAENAEKNKEENLCVLRGKIRHKRGFQ